nr:cytochrome P450 18a1 [Parasteatoda tepidariorum]
MLVSLIRCSRMDTLSYIFFPAVVILVSLWLTKSKKVKNPLPGPRGLPLIGYLPFLTKKPYVKLHELAKTYGPVYSVPLGSRNVVILSDFKSIKDAFSNDVFMGRPGDLPFELSETSRKSGAMLGMPWKEQRRFSLHMLRDLGFGKTKMEAHMKDEILELFERIEEKDGSPIPTKDFLTPSMSNNIASLLFGKRLKYNDPKRQKLDKLLHEVGRLVGSVMIFTFFPWLAALLNFFNIGNKKKLSKALSDIKAYVREECEEHEATLDTANIRDFIDGYLIEIQKRANDANSTFHKDVLEDLSRLFFGAGSETVRITVEWMILLYAAFPEVQRKVQAEIDEALGTDRFPTWQDRFDMPYTEATILELMRWKSIIALNVLRSNLVDTELNGYFIPKNSYVLANLHAVAYDKSLWGNDVEEYKPERFLNEDRTKVIKPEYFIPFSIGKRQCPGKPLAEIEVFLYVAATLQKFKVSIPSGNKADLEAVLGIGLQPKKQDIVFESRNKLRNY